MNSRSFYLAHAQDIVGIIAILLFSRARFRPEVSLSIIVKCNVDRKVTGIGIGNERSRSTNRIRFYYNV